jgi:Flp pilus assembly protein TadD
MFYAIALAELGRKDRAIAEGAAAVDLSPNDSVMLYNGACLYARLGEKQKAIATLREAIAAGVTNFSWMAHDPDLDSLRGEPDFVALFQPNS